MIVMDQYTGQIIAMASYPTFDNRWFSADVDSEKFDQIFPRQVEGAPRLDPDLSTLNNRAIQGQYNMGSTFKVFTAYSALATGRLGPGSTYNDQGSYKLVSIDDDVCAGGVRCVFRNSICSHTGQPCVYGTVGVTTSLAVSSDAFYYKLGEEFYLTPGTPLQDNVRLFGFGSDTGIDLPYEFDGRVPTDELKAQLVEDGVLHPDETPNLQPGDLVQMAIGQGLMAATPLQLAVGYATFANGGWVLTPHVVKAIYEPEVPDGEPGFADLTQAHAGPGDRPADRARSRWTRTRSAGRSSTACGATSPAPAPTGGRRRPRSCSPTTRTMPSRSPARRARRRAPAATRGTTRRPSPPSASIPSTRTPSSRTSRSPASARVAPAPVVKCMYLALSNLVPLDPVNISEPLDVTSERAAEDLAPVDLSCGRSTAPETTRPVD